MELNIPWEERLEEIFERKLSKYVGLVIDCQQARWMSTSGCWIQGFSSTFPDQILKLFGNGGEGRRE